MEENEEKTSSTDGFACTGCGANLTYQPGTTTLSCPYCGAENEILEIEECIEELDFDAYLADASEKEEHLVQHFVKCDCCGASCTLEPQVTASDCPYCGTPLIVEHAKDESVIQPKSMLPFRLNKEKAHAAFETWVKKQWFAPGDFKKASLNFDHFKGVYIPYWTYDTQTFSSYVGQRGTYYYVTQRRNGKSERVRKIRWSSVRGNMDTSFDDLLIPATESLPKKCIEKLEPWDLDNLVPFDRSYLSGFHAEKYQTSLENGFYLAKVKAEKIIRERVKRDIGGDQQRITALNTSYSHITFKHLLLPAFVCAYRFKNKVFQFLVNGRTGEVQGERPWSWIKITGAAMGAVLLAGLILFVKGQLSQ